MGVCPQHAEHVGEVELLHVASQQHVEADLYQGLTPRDIDAVEYYWYPPINDAIAGIRQKVRSGELETEADVRSALLSLSLEDWGWDWRLKSDSLNHSADYEAFVLRYAERPQGLMIAKTAGVARIASQAGSSMVYVDYLATAPWNRSSLNNGCREYKGVGVVMILAAISLSIEQGFEGRIGLHSLPQAHSFYAGKLGMNDLGVDVNKEGLNYFEFTPRDASRLLGQ